MKKAILSIALAFTVSMLAEEYAFPGWNAEKSAYDTGIAAYEQAAENAKPCKPYIYERMKVARAILGNEYLEFGAIRSVVEGLSLSNVDSFMLEACNINYYRIAGAHATEAAKIMRDCYDYLCEKESFIRFIMVYTKDVSRNVGFTNDEIVKILFDGIIEKKISKSNLVTNALNCLYECCPKCTISEEEQLACFKKVNRIVSVNLIDGDKEVWEPIVAKLRTVIASY